MPTNLLLAPVVQLAYVVPDARAAALDAAQPGVAGPFFLNERIQLAWGEHRGAPADLTHTSAYGQCGALMLEFLQPESTGPSPFHQPDGALKTGLHHVATIVPSLVAAYRHYADRGVGLAGKAATAQTGTEFAFVDTEQQLGHLVEIYEQSDALLGFYRLVRDAAEDWDGGDPLRVLR